MSRPKGLAKTGGRTKGAPNKRSAVLFDRLDEIGFDPVGELIVSLRKLDDFSKVGCLLKLLDYLYPKKRPEDLQGSASVDGPVMPNSYDLSCLSIDELKQLESITSKMEINQNKVKC